MDSEDKRLEDIKTEDGLYNSLEKELITQLERARYDGMKICGKAILGVVLEMTEKDCTDAEKLEAVINFCKKSLGLLN